MKVALTAEGTYPHQFGGVSVWCDQLVRTLPGYEFAVLALTATGAEPVRWELPGNVTDLATIPLWAPPSAAKWTRDRRGVPAPVRALITALLDSPAPGISGEPPAGGGFGRALRELCEFAAGRNLTAALSSDAAVRLLSTGWRERWPGMAAAAGTAPPTLHDAVTLLQLAEHALRPLSRPPARADLTHVVTNGLAALPALAAKWRDNVPMIISEHGVLLREQYLHLRRPPFGWPVKELYLRFLAQVCALGYREAELVIPGNVYNRRWEVQLGVDPARIRTIYNGVDAADFPPVTSEPAEPTVTWVGRIDPVKDLETMLRAHALLLRQWPGTRLRVFGPPAPGLEAYHQRCRDLASELGIAGSVTFEGRVPEVRDAYAAGTIVAMSSISEGFPYTLIEAMTCGRACVATDVGGVGEALADGAGLIVPPRDPAALAAACLRLLRAPALRETLGAAARARALEHFTVQAAIGAFEEIYALVGTGRQVRPDTPPATAPQAATVTATATGRAARDGTGGTIRSGGSGWSPVTAEGGIS